VRVCTRLTCGLSPAGQQLAWLRGGLQWRAEVDFPAEVSMLWGHVASCRLTRPGRSRISCCSPNHRHRLCRTRDLVILDLLWRRGGLKKRGSNWPGVMGGPVWGGRQAAGKADSQAFSGKRLPHPWGGSFLANQAGIAGRVQGQRFEHGRWRVGPCPLGFAPSGRAHDHFH
jgi:hypothetical protein